MANFVVTSFFFYNLRKKCDSDDSYEKKSDIFCQVIEKITLEPVSGLLAHAHQKKDWCRRFDDVTSVLGLSDDVDDKFRSVNATLCRYVSLQAVRSVLIQFKQMFFFSAHIAWKPTATAA